MTEASVLKHFNLNCQAILETDASDLVTDGILSQYDNEGVFHSMTFYNKSMISVECNYHIYDKKLLVIFFIFFFFLFIHWVYAV